MRTGFRWLKVWQQRSSAWGAVLDEQTMVLAALARQSSGDVRVVMFDHVQAPAGLVHPAQRDAWLVQSLQGAGEQLPRRHRTMALALHESRCRQGQWLTSQTSARVLDAEVRQQAARALGLSADAIGYDFECDALPASPGLRCLRWAACAREDLQQWQSHARRAGWRLPVVEPAEQAVERATRHWRGEALHHWTTSPQDWQFEAKPLRQLQSDDWSQLRASSMWVPLAACGAALGALA